MQEQSSSSSQAKPIQGENANQNQEENLDVLQEQCNRIGRRNALTPESHNIEPIRQTEIQEKMSNLSMASTSETNNSCNNQAGE